MKMTTLAVMMAATLATTAYAEEKLEDWQVKALEKIKQEKVVRDAIWSQSISLWVSVDDNGSNRRGFGEYLCIVLSQVGRPEGKFVAISVLDHAASLRQERKELGKAICQ